MASLCLALAAPGASFAAPAQDLSRVLDDASPTGVAVVPLSTGASAAVGDVTLELPGADDAAIAVSGGSSGRPLQAEIVLPRQFDTTAGRDLADGAVVYPDRGRAGDHLAVQMLADGSTRIETILSNSSSPREYSYELTGFTPAEADGAFGFVGAGSDAAFVPVAAAWATDARGEAVPTHYEIRGQSLTQIVEPRAEAVYPIVADPVWSWMWGGYGAKLDRYETHRVRDFFAAYSMCGLISRGYPTAALACGAYGGYITAQANLAESDRPRTCLYLVVIPAPLVMRYRDGHCR